MGLHFRINVLSLPVFLISQFICQIFSFLREKQSYQTEVRLNTWLCFLNKSSNNVFKECKCPSNSFINSLFCQQEQFNGGIAGWDVGGLELNTVLPEDLSLSIYLHYHFYCGKKWQLPNFPHVPYNIELNTKMHTYCCGASLYNVITIQGRLTMSDGIYSFVINMAYLWFLGKELHFTVLPCCTFKHVFLHV